MNDTNKKFAVDLFNEVWKLLDKSDRTEDEDYLMVHSAHASLYHWLQVDTHTQTNIYIGEWQISRVYSILKNFESAIYHGKKALKICKKNQLNGFNLAYAYEAMARAYSIIENKEECLKYMELAKKESEAITSKEEKEMLISDLKTII
jgi:tetratricopeptide (TPR) repeat protein